MKLDLLKKLIKEAVKEAVREELETILSEPAKQPIHEAAPKTFTQYNNYKPVKSTYVSTGDPMADLLEETRQGMLSGGNAGTYPDMSQMISAPGLGMQPNMVMEESFARPEPGIDLSQFDFIKKAGAIYKASNERDRQRFGA